MSSNPFTTAKALAEQGQNPMPEPNPEVANLLQIDPAEITALFNRISYARAEPQLEITMQAQALKQQLGELKAYAVFNVISESGEHVTPLAAFYADDAERLMLAHASFSSQRMIKVLIKARGGRPVDISQLCVIWAEGGSTMMLQTALQVSSRTPLNRNVSN